MNESVKQAPAQNSLQQQSSQAQNSVSTQNNVASLQNNGSGQTFLNQTAGSVLSVFSSPTDATADAIVNQSSTIATAPIKTTNSGSSGSGWIIFVLSTLIIVVFLYGLYRRRMSPVYVQSEATTPEPEEIVSAQTVTTIKSKKQKRKKKKHGRVAR